MPLNQINVITYFHRFTVYFITVTVTFQQKCIGAYLERPMQVGLPINFMSEVDASHNYSQIKVEYSTNQLEFQFTCSQSRPCL